MDELQIEPIDESEPTNGYNESWKNRWAPFWSGLIVFVIGFFWLAFAQIAGLVGLIVRGLSQTNGQISQDQAMALLADGDLVGISFLLALPLVIFTLSKIITSRRQQIFEEYLGLQSVKAIIVARWLSYLLLYWVLQVFLNVVFHRPQAPEWMLKIYATADLMWLLFAAIVLLGPILEELLYRGYILRVWSQSWLGVTGSVILLSLMWAGIHLQYDLYDMTMIFFLGVLFSLSRIRTGSIIPALVMHMANNALSFFALLILKFDGWFFAGWRVDFLPEVLAYKPGSNSERMTNLAILVGVSLVCPLITVLVSKLFRNKKKKINPVITTLYLILSMIQIFRIANPPDSVGLYFLYPLLAILALHFVLVITAFSGWLQTWVEGYYVSPPGSFLKCNYWLSNRMLFYFLTPFILFRMPVFHNESLTFYWGTPLLMGAAYFLYHTIFVRKLHRLLKLEVPVPDLPDHLREKFTRVMEPLKELCRPRIMVIERGFYNAVALYPEKEVVIGLDLLDQLDVEQNQAIMAHELGHIDDAGSLKRISRRFRIGTLLIFFYFILDQINSPSLRFLPLALILCAFFIMIVGVKKIKLQAEFNADSFVKKFHGSIYPHLKPALEKLLAMNLIDKDYCKTRNAAHLDIDERQRMVEEGEFRLPKRSSKKAVLVFAGALAIGIASVFLYHKMFPSEKVQWQKLHSKFHALKYGSDSKLAGVAISEAFEFSQEHFGRVHNRTLTILNDLCEFHSYIENWPMAEQYCTQAYEVGLELYENRDLKLVRPMKNLAELRQDNGNFEDAARWYKKNLELQTDLGALDSDRTATLKQLAGVSINLGKKDQAEAYYLEALGMYDHPETIHDYNSVDISIKLAGLILDKGDHEGADRHLDNALSWAKTLDGEEDESDTYSYIIQRIAELYNDNGDSQAAKRIYRNGIDYIKASGALNDAGLANLLYYQGKLFYENGDFNKAIDSLTQGAAILGNPIGEPYCTLVQYQWMLAAGYEEVGDLNKAKEFYEQVAKSEEEAGDTDPEVQIETYTKLLAVLEKIGEPLKIVEVTKKLEELKSKSKGV